MDYNLVHYPGLMEPIPALNLAEQSKHDEHSILADAMFVDPDKGDFRVKDGSPALKLGFVNFPMDQFGVQKPELKAIARTPEIPKLEKPDRPTRKVQYVKPANYAWQASIRDISGLGERSAYGLPDETGVLLLNVPAASPAAKAGLQKNDVILACNGQPVRTMKDLQELRDKAAGSKLPLSIIRKQKRMSPVMSTRFQTTTCPGPRCSRSARALALVEYKLGRGTGGVRSVRGRQGIRV